MSYEVQTDVFKGPFDLLLHLILKQQVELYDINLSEIVDEYLRQIELLEQLDLEVATEFLLIAATLVELKTRRFPLPFPFPSFQMNGWHVSSVKQCLDHFDAHGISPLPGSQTLAADTFAGRVELPDLVSLGAFAVSPWQLQCCGNCEPGTLPCRG